MNATERDQVKDIVKLAIREEVNGKIDRLTDDVASLHRCVERQGKLLGENTYQPSRWTKTSERVDVVSSYVMRIAIAALVAYVLGTGQLPS